MVEQRKRCYVGLELGQGADPTALALLQRPWPHQPLKPTNPRPVYELRFLRRFHPGTPFEAIAEATRILMDVPEARFGFLGVDLTGVGRAVVNTFVEYLQTRITCKFTALTITAGQDFAPNHRGGGILVPKKDLIGNLQVLLQTHRLLMPRSLPDVQVLLQELENFRMRVPLTPMDTLEAWREGQHDDLVLAVAMAGWLGELSLLKVEK